MKILVYFLYNDCEVSDWLDDLELDPTFEKRKVGGFGAHKYQELLKTWKTQPPGVFITIHPDFEPFFCLNQLPYEFRRRWLYFKSKEDFHAFSVTNCFLGYVFEHKNDMNPLLSVFTTTYKSKHRILRPYHSLLQQTYQNWEWVIIDDTNEADEEDAAQQTEMLKRIEESDPRIRVYKPYRHSGIIGSLKKQACGLCMGEWLLEMDHDDDLVPELFQWIVDCHRQYKDATFIYSDCIETYEGTMQSQSYGDFFGLGYGAYYTTLFKNHFQNVCTGCPINRLTMSHIVGVPNHIRCWKKEFYHKINGHNEHLPVADDYELILRTVLHSDCWVRINALGYIQYRNEGGNNFTFLRNQLIQDLVRLISARYNEPLRLRFNDLLQIQEEEPMQRLVKPIYHYSKFFYPVLEKTYSPNIPPVSIVLPTFNRPQHLLRAIQSVLNQTFPHWHLYIIGDHCSQLPNVMEALRQTGQYDHRFRWWNLNDNHGAGGAIPRNYALYLAQTEWIAYIDDDNTWEPDHLQSFMDIAARDPDVKFMFSGFKINNETEHVVEYPVKGGLDTSAVCHKRELIYTHGLWQNREEAGYCHDFVFFSKFLHEKWAPTMKATMNYYTEFNNQTAESIRQLYEYHKTEFLCNQMSTA